MGSNKLSENEIRSLLPKELSALPILVYDEIDSTNTESKRLIQEKGFNNALVLANFQTQGRGRVGHSFLSPKGSGIYMSYIFTPNSLEGAEHATTKAAVAVLKSLSQLYDITASVKWVNDIYYCDKKICGILTEAVTSGINKGSLIIGIGINFKKFKLPDALKETAGFLPAKENVTRNLLIAKILSNLYPETKDLLNNSYIKDYREASLLTDKDISFYEKEVLKYAHVLDIDEDAGLIVKLQDGTVTTLHNGEVFTVRKV